MFLRTVTRIRTCTAFPSSVEASYISVLLGSAAICSEMQVVAHAGFSPSHRGCSFWWYYGFCWFPTDRLLRSAFLIGTLLRWVTKNAHHMGYTRGCASCSINPPLCQAYSFLRGCISGAKSEPVGRRRSLPKCSRLATPNPLPLSRHAVPSGP